MSNRLAEETNPYLLQHKDNPVDWYPWGTEALAAARKEDKPILLSVGYAACHWCHVMERESFEDQTTADYMNEHFVSIKVDREERPDIDAIYMEAVQSITGSGGWPLTAFLDPDGVPFHGGTYFPPDSSRGMPSFMMVMDAVQKAFAERRDEIRSQAADVRTRLGAVSLISAREGDLDPGLLADRTSTLLNLADLELGGFGPAPKFPPASTLDFLLSRGETEPVEVTLDRMGAGGIYDQIGGGFARYSVDAAWLVPHFEKMLYDNALLARTYLHAWQELGHDRYRRIAEETLDWLLREMRDDSGGFYASLDADSEGEEGIFYTWTIDELRAVLGGRADLAIETFGVTIDGNFEGRNVLHFPLEQPPGKIDAELESIRSDLLAARSERVRPALDDKVILSWNALAISALAEAGTVLDRPDYLDAAEACSGFIWKEMRDAQGSLRRSWRQGDARLNAYLEDHAFLLEALLTLYQANFSESVFKRAQGLAETMIDRFSDPDRGGFFTTSHDHEELIARRKDVGDHPIPSGSASAALGLLRLGNLTGENHYLRQSLGVLKLLAPATARQPDAFGHLLQALQLFLAPSGELAISTPGKSPDEADALLEVFRSRYRPNFVVALGPEGSSTPPLLESRTAVDGKPTAYVCENFTCQAPVTEPAALRKELDANNS
ncbi:MAG: thioredoxin domain-containing protein [Solirubrobacterales bacterium]|nr:thioredoxin domain-containing protein [Solirubrobacterales bacterium]